MNVNGGGEWLVSKVTNSNLDKYSQKRVYKREYLKLKYGGFTELSQTQMYEITRFTNEIKSEWEKIQEDIDDIIDSFIFKKEDGGLGLKFNNVINYLKVLFENIDRQILTNDSTYNHTTMNSDHNVEEMMKYIDDVGVKETDKEEMRMITPNVFGQKLFNILKKIKLKQKHNISFKVEHVMIGDCSNFSYIRDAVTTRQCKYRHVYIKGIDVQDETQTVVVSPSLIKKDSRSTEENIEIRPFYVIGPVKNICNQRV
tara:strand:+ start:493 stop:1260 length:768 start_codon:yes stop_codon:yes gene_type:complete